MATSRQMIQDYGGGSRQAASDYNFLMETLKKRMRDAQKEDVQYEKNIKSTVKTGLDAIKTRREYLLAKRFNPDLKFKDFLLDPRTAGDYMLEGQKKIVSGEASPITLGETFGFKPKKVNNFTNQPIEELSQESQEVGPGKTFRYRPSAVNTAPEANLAPQKEVFDFSGVSEDVINKYKNELAGGGVNWKRNLQDALNVGIEKRIVPAKGSSGLTGALEKAEGTLSESGDKVSALGTAGKVLGGIGSLASLGSGISDIAKGKGNLSSVAKAGAGAAGLASLAYGINPLFGMGLGLLSSVSKRRR